MNEFDYLAKANQYELNSRTEWLCDLKNDVAQYNKLIAVQRTILHEIKLDSLIQNIEIKQSEIFEKENEKRELEAEIAKIEQELAQLKTE